jgi:hypothetical protein
MVNWISGMVSTTWLPGNGEHFHIHPLALEAFSATQRPKVGYDDHFLIIVK